MTRIISGRAGGLRLQTPPGSGTRPTSDRVREALFSRLEHLDVLAGAAVLDLYAGSGALGLEAASRGATSVLLVESDRTAAAVARRNALQTGIPGIVVRAATVERTLATAPGDTGDGGFIDPPYDISEDALVVVERSSRSPEPRWPAGLEREGERRYGETRVWFAGVPEKDGVA